MEEEDKENNSLQANLPNRFDHIEVGLTKGQFCSEKSEKVEKN